MNWRTKIINFFLKENAPSESARKEKAAREREEKRSGFVLITNLSRNKTFWTEGRVVFSLAGFIAFLAVILILIGLRASPEFIIITSAILALTGVLLFDVLGRRRWENEISRQIKKLSQNHDRLVREVARNRNDIAGLKDGLAGTAASIEEQGKRYTPSNSVEARMIESIVEQLGALGDKPRADIHRGPDREILELEMAPPPLAAPPPSGLHEEVEPDFSKLSDTIVIDLIRRAVRNDTIDIVLQPVVSLPQRKPRLYEVYARVRADSGTYLPAARYMSLAAREELIPAIDNLLLLRCLQILRDQKDDRVTTPFILNIASSTLHDQGFMGDLVAFLSQHRRTASRLIFEMSQNDLTSLEEELVPVLDGLSQLGCRFSMDRVRDRKIDIHILKSRHVRFLKLDAGWLVKEGQSKNGFSRIVRMKKQLDRAGIDLIVEKIETEKLLRELLDYNIDYGQGYLFGKPDVPTTWKDGLKAA